MYSFVLFDMDGVLIDSENAITEACVQALAEYGVRACHQDFLPFTGMGEDRFIGGVAQKYGLQYKPEMKESAYALYEQFASTKLVVYDGIKDMLNTLRSRGVKIAVGSAADVYKVHINLKTIGVTVADFDAVVTGSDIVNKKPDPEIYLTAAAKIGAVLGKTLVVEDALSGVQAGVAAGFDVAGVTTSFSAEKLTAVGARFIVSKTPDILTIPDFFA